MANDATNTAPIATDAPADVCGYAVDARLSSPDAPPSYLAVGPGGRGVVLKPLESDCLLPKGTLHPNIRDRLARVRELAMTGVANLYGVERDAGSPDQSHPGEAWLVWEYVPGRTFDQYAADRRCSPRDLLTLARELILAIDTLHLQGIVHGSIKGGNVIVGPHGSVRLTHVSPLLYADPAEDARCVVELLADVVGRRKEEVTPFGRAVTEAAESCRSDDGPAAVAALRRLATRLAALADARGAAPARAESDEPRADRGPRRRSLVGAAAVTLAGLLVAYVALAAAGRSPLPVPRALQQTIDARLGR